jgi:hypothetical protein
MYSLWLLARISHKSRRQSEAKRLSPFFSVFVSNLAEFAVTCTTFLLRPRQQQYFP